MIELDFSLTPSEYSRVAELDFKSLTLTDLHYYYFCGDVRFRVGKANFDACWGWVPIVNFAAQLYEITRHLEEEKSDILEFTESCDNIRFTRHGAHVEVRATYSDSTAVVSLRCLQQAARDFFERILSYLVESWPGLLDNPHICAMRSLLGTRKSS